jgi:hypothetical protein
MKGDYSRDTFDPIKHFSRLLMQQGRVQLDADWNEQASIFLHYLRTLAVDLIGPHGGPADDLGFAITPKDLPNARSLDIGFGHYYVDGILCENEEKTPSSGGDNVRLPSPSLGYFNQPDYPLVDPETGLDDKLPEEALFVYLDVWERHITYIQDDSIREVALGGPDTAARAKTVWQVKVKPLVALTDLSKVEVGQITCDSPPLVEVMNNLRNLLQPANRGRMAARAQVPEDTDAIDVCIVSPEARYRGAENQLYRVEIHDGGKAWDGHTAGATEFAATFKWSRENGSVVFAIQSLSGRTLTLENLGRDDRFGLEVGDWVEVVDDDYVLLGRAEPLLQVEAIDPIDRLVTLSGTPAANVGINQSKHPLLRRWDQQPGDPATGGLQLTNDGAALIVGSNTAWLNLEDGVQVQFQEGVYRTGDYWLIPARTATGNVEWPLLNGKPSALQPHGVEHHYAPLAVVFPQTDKGFVATDLRHSIAPLGSCCPRIEVLNPPTATNTALTGNRRPIPFTARVSGRSTDLKYRWRADGGTIQGKDNTASIMVAPADDKSTVVTAVVVIEGLPGDCPNTAMGACALTKP